MVALAKINEKAAKIAVKGSAKILRIVRSRVYPQAVDAFASRIKICEYRKPICEKQTALRTVQPCWCVAREWTMECLFCQKLDRP